MGKIKVLGVHPIPAQEPVHLIEIEFEGSESIDFGQITQAVVGQPEDEWQVAYDEQEIETDGFKSFAFFFHYLHIDEPLSTPLGLVPLPAPTPVPAHLENITYDEP